MEGDVGKSNSCLEVECNSLNQFWLLYSPVTIFPPHPPSSPLFSPPLFIFLPHFLPRSVSLSSLKLLTQKNFSLSLILNHLTPSILINLAHLAGYLDAKHSLLSILQQAHGSAKSFPQVISKSLPYHQLCESVLQMAATKSLHTILFNESVIQLLNYHPPSIDVVVAGGYMDKSELASTVCDVLKCIVARAINPSPLKPTLKLLELERVHAVLTYECLASTAECEYVLCSIITMKYSVALLPAECTVCNQRWGRAWELLCCTMQTIVNLYLKQLSH